MSNKNLNWSSQLLLNLRVVIVSALSEVKGRSFGENIP
nr:MAG TPA: hypothetical protein [Caudoviricetes sp.]DAI24739.1 MAG TPA: hypothetical protein [Caudoviricetes sp.]